MFGWIHSYLWVAIVLAFLGFSNFLSSGIPDEPSMVYKECLGIIYCIYVCVLWYTTAHLQVLFSSQHLGGITKVLQ